MDSFLVYIVDDDAGVLDSLHRILTAEGAVATTYPSADAFVADCPSQDAACLILDLRMPGMTGLGLIDWLKAHRIEIPVIVLSGHSDVPAVVDSIRHGAVDFLEKPVDPALLIQKVRALAKIYRDQIIVRAKRQQLHNRFAHLTDRENELLDLLVQGMSSKQIAVAKNISVKTVENHRSHLLAKTHAVNVASLVSMKLQLDNRAA
jgi:FixJ family two-component response regulator